MISLRVITELAGLAALDAPVRPPEAVLGRQSAAAREAAQAMALLGSAAVEQLLVGERDALAKALALRAALLLACLMVGGYLLVCMYKVMVGGLGFLCSQVDELGRGNLAIRPSGHGQDEIGQALTALGRAAAHMSTLFEAVNSGVAAVSHASREVAMGNSGLSGRTGEIRSAIDTVAINLCTW